MQQNYNKSAMLNGLTVGGLLSLKFIFSSTKIPLLSLLAILISIYIVYTLFTLSKNFIKTENTSLSFIQRFSYTFLVYFYGCLLSSLVVLIYTKYFVPQFLEELKTETLKVYEELNIQMSSSQIDIIEFIHSRPEIYTITNILAYIITGAFWAIILNLFLTKVKNSTVE